ncbi:MAG: WD40 repeat domain-containing protein, partial [Pirellulales bacterium]|nr:WD40 repeat domain-containing protein [Pirellulales bacterium]
GLQIATADSDDNIRLWSAKTGKQLGEISEGSTDLEQLAFVPNNKALLASNEEDEVYCWVSPHVPAKEDFTEDRTKELLQQLGSNKFTEREEAQRALIAGGNRVLRFLPTGAITDPEVKLRIANIRERVAQSQLTTKPLEKPLELKGGLGKLCCHPDGRHFAIVEGHDANAQIVIGQITETGLKVVRRLSDGHSPESLHFTRDGRRLVTSNRDGTVSVYDMAP